MVSQGEVAVNNYGDVWTLNQSVTIGICESLDINNVSTLVMDDSQILINYGTINITSGNIRVLGNTTGIVNYGTINCLSGLIDVFDSGASMLTSGIWHISPGFIIRDD